MRYAFLLLGHAYLFLASQACGSVLFSISDVHFVAIGKSQQERPLGTEAQLQPGEVLRLYFTVRGNDIALSALERDGSLSVITRWCNDSSVTDPGFDVGLDTDKWDLDEASLKEQVDQNGTFEWHTYADKANWSPGVITIDCLDQNHALAQDVASGDADIYFKILN